MVSSLSFHIESKKMQVTFSRDKETKNTVRFTAPMGGEISGSIYVNKNSELSSEQEIVVEIQENAVVTA